MSLKTRIHQDLVAAMKAKDERRVWTLRTVWSAIQVEEKKKGDEATDAVVLRVLSTLLKQRKEAAEQFQAGHRSDLVEKELAEAAIIEEYLPPPLSEEELRAEIRAVIAETGGRKLGQIMPVIMQRVAGRAEGKVVNALVQQELARIQQQD
ncbi:MAG: GatB/YqeY domain-containing protein [Nitrospinota bacterium]|nr:MAG: GatB/YqeY domain-containing protein [Nitrospinota bacterium]